MHWLNSARRLACEPMVVEPAPGVWLVCRSYPPTWQKKICRFMPNPPLAASFWPALMSRAIIFNCGPSDELKAFPPVGEVMLVGKAGDQTVDALSAMALFNRVLV